MVRYKYIDLSPRLVKVDLDEQLIPGTFEHALNIVIDRIDLSGFDARFRNHLTGATAYPPAVLLKVILLAYSKGMISSRDIAHACQEHCTFIALSGDTQPHFTTIAKFVRTLGDQAAHVFGAVLAVCAKEGLIGREMFAIDGVKLPSNASKHRSGTRSDFEHRAARMEEQAKEMMERHRAEDRRRRPSKQREREQQRLGQLQRGAEELRQWLEDNPADRTGKSLHDGRTTIRQSNLTDNESAKLSTDKGVIQGYTGVAAVDDVAQIVVCAQAHGTGNEHELLIPVIDDMEDQISNTTIITTDSGFHCEANLKVLEERGIDALIADKAMRQRDPLLADQAHHLVKADPLYDKRAKEPEHKLFTASDFSIDLEARTCVCPSGKNLYRRGQITTKDGLLATRFQGAKRDCVPCLLRDQCLRTPEVTLVRQISVFHGKADSAKNTCSERMRARIDSPEGRAIYERRLATVEPVFANLRHNKRMNRFTMRGRTKVDGQWKMFCVVHNIEKLAHHSYAQ